MDVIGTIEQLGSATSKKGKPYDFLTLTENKARYMDFGGHIKKACVKEGDKIRIKPWDTNANFIDQLENVPQTTQTTIEAPTTPPKEEQPKYTPDDREATIQYLATMKAVSGLPVSLKIMTDEEVTILAENLVKITEKVIELRKKKPTQ